MLEVGVLDTGSGARSGGSSGEPYYFAFVDIQHVRRRPNAARMG
jgi:hypothetical protein